jgi:hypothetical protein
MNQMNFHLSPYFHKMSYLFDHFPLNDWWLVHFLSLVWSSISPNKYVTSSFHHSTTCFSWWTSRLVLRPPGPSSMTKPPRPMSCRRKLRPVVPGWMIAAGFHYPSGMIIIHSYPLLSLIGESPINHQAILEYRDASSIIIHYIWEYPQLID